MTGGMAGPSGFVPQSPARVLASWAVLGAMLLAGAVALALASPLFEWQREVAEMPSMALALGLAGAGVAVAFLPCLIRMSLVLPSAKRRCLFIGVLALGVAVRLALFVSEPALEDDYNRYLWEGALITHGISPYRVTPRDGMRATDTATPLGALARTAGPVLERVNHPELTTMYQPVALLLFAAANRISPWDLRAWRAMALVTDVSVLALLLALLATMGRSPLWVALYWWNPLIAKEIVNAAHFDVLPVALVLSSLLLSARRSHIAAAVVLGLAVGAKLWPLMLTPLLIRAAHATSQRAMAMAAIIAMATTLSLLPRWMAEAGDIDGLAAYARLWTTNSALSPLMERFSMQVLAPFGMSDQAWRLARGVAAGLVLIRILIVSARPVAGTDDLLRRAGEVALWVVLLSPAQFPWYAVWCLPFAAFGPRRSFAVMTVMLPLYYTSFHWLARDAYPIFSNGVVWLIWCPIWIAVAADSGWLGPRWRILWR